MKNDKRLKDLFCEPGSGNANVMLTGFPSDEGVKRNSGRPGASKAPELIVDQLLKMTPHALHSGNHTALLRQTAGMEFLPCTGDVETDQARLGEHLSAQIASGIIPVIIGGGHETSFGHFLGYANSGILVSIINIDAHTDVRPLKDGKAHSGSPFYQAIKYPSGLCKSYNVYGLNPSTVAADHMEFVREQGEARFEEESSKKNVLRCLEKSEHPVMVTMDMDAVGQAEAPGVSAPNASGISKQLWLDLAFEFGKSRRVASFDLCEVNPVFDRDNQTVKLAALTIWYFLLGVSLRK